MKMIAGMVLLIAAATSAKSQVLPHIAVGGSYTTEFLVLNTGTAAGSVSASFFDDTGKAMTVAFPDLKTTGSGFQTSSPLPAYGSLVVVANDPSGPTRGGSAVISASAGIVVQAIFRSKAPDGNFYEAAVPASGGSTRFTLAFDATTFGATGAQIYTGLAITNLDSAKPATVSCTARSNSGVTISNALNVPLLQPRGHWADYNFPALLGKRGLLDCTSDTNVAAIGLRFLGSNAFSSLVVVQSTAPAGTTPGTPTSSAVVGQWANRIEQSFFDGYYLPHRDYAVSLSFRSDGTYTYGVSQSFSPVWQLSVTGKYVVGSAPANNYRASTQVVLTPLTISLPGLADSVRSTEISRLAYEGFPGITSEAFLVTWDSTGAMSMKNAQTNAHSCVLLPGGK